MLPSICFAVNHFIYVVANVTVFRTNEDKKYTAFLELNAKYLHVVSEVRLSISRLG